jgi:vacuolar-type H+-ATPase subunit F/Vma7
MRLLVAGRPQEIRGFALAGVETLTCHSRADAEAVVEQFGGDVGLLIVPRWLADAASERLARIRQRQGWPIVLVLPAAAERPGDR